MQKQTCIITAAALVLSLGLAHAQGSNNEAKVRVKGEHNDHQITQVSRNGTIVLTQGTSSQQTMNSTAKVYMFGLDNEVRIEQLNSWSDKVSVESEGQRGTVFIQQRNSEANQAEVDQFNGEASEAIIRQKQKGNEAQIIQSNNYQEAIIDQDGDRNKGYIQQATIRVSESRISSAFAAQQNKASLRQRGQDNTGVIAQDGAEGDVKITQHGEDNFAYVYQGAETGTPVQNQAVVSQEGSLNRTSVYQSDNSSIVDVVLVGTGNSSEIAQGGIIPATPPSVYPF